MKQGETTYYWSGYVIVLKRSIDILFSLIALIALSPLFFLLFLTVGLSSGFPVFYKQKRIGKNEKEFFIFKFRTMQIDAEKEGPQLSNESDNRVVGFGKILRKWRLDELPQFLNVLLGDMSLVGPRPERRYYVDLLKDSVPEYSLLFNVKPGITSSGMVNFGYASNLEEMKTRAPYDIAYVKNLSLKQDLSIVIKTLTVIVEGSGK